MSNLNHQEKSGSQVSEAAAHNATHKLSTRRQPSQRRHFGFISKHKGFFLTRYTPDSKILGFFGGAMRVQVSRKTEIAYIYTPQYLLECFEKGNMNPEPQTIVLEGKKRFRDLRVSFDDIPAYTELVENTIGEELISGGAWGVFHVFPSPHKLYDGPNINGVTMEQYLNSSTWKVVKEAGVPGAGGDSLPQRLDENAFAISQVIPTAWQLATTASVYFGGMTNNIADLSKMPGEGRFNGKPPAHQTQLGDSMGDLIARENDMRTRKRVRMAQRSAERRVRRQGGFPLLSSEMASKLEAVTKQ